NTDIFCEGNFMVYYFYLLLVEIAKPPIRVIYSLLFQISKPMHNEKQLGIGITWCILKCESAV
ncbi:MAG: hypothetical protein JZU53_14840, partial [Paludibacter sp.]|nr:hypothetical protein [Paludibacter sp.]